MALPTLTWNLVGPMLITSGNLPQPSGGTAGSLTKQYVMFTLQQLIASSTYWQVDVQDVTGSATEALVLRPNPSLSALPNMRVVVTMNVSGVLGGASTSQIMQDRVVGTAAAATANAVYIGFSPDISPNPTWVTGSWNSDKPWGPNVRWSKYWVMFQNAQNRAELMYLIESSEALWIGFKGRSGINQSYGGGCGAWLQSIDSGSGEFNVGGVGRVFSMSVIGGGNTANGAPAASWLTTTQGGVNSLGFFGCNTNIDASTYSGYFIVSGGVANGPTPTGAANSNNWDLCVRAATYTINPPSDTTSDRGSTMTSSDVLTGIPIPIINTAGQRFVGFLRQTYVIRDMPHLMTILSGTNVNNTTGSVIGYTFSIDTYNANDTVLFANS